MDCGLRYQTEQIHLSLEVSLQLVIDFETEQIHLSLEVSGSHVTLKMGYRYLNNAKDKLMIRVLPLSTISQLFSLSTRTPQYYDKSLATSDCDLINVYNKNITSEQI